MNIKWKYTLKTKKMILKGESAEEFNRKADENYEKYKARQKQTLIDMMEADEKLGLYQKPTKLYTIEDIERCVENWGLCKVEREYIEKFLATKQVVKDSLTPQTVEERFTVIPREEVAKANARIKKGMKEAKNKRRR